ncbi:hypothetical protein HDV00_002328 [Rhizophlyctis rosea]|nr:hypothetical protein HDV00_002328 [Rhizophlyctis rosea]
MSAVVITKLQAVRFLEAGISYLANFHEVHSHIHKDFQHTTAPSANVHNAYKALTTTQTRDTIITTLHKHNIDCRQKSNTEAYDRIASMCGAINYEKFKAQIDFNFRAGGTLRFFVEQEGTGEEGRELHGVVCSWSVMKQVSKSSSGGFRIAVNISWHSLHIPENEARGDEDDSLVGSLISGVQSLVVAIR